MGKEKIPACLRKERMKDLYRWLAENQKWGKTGRIRILINVLVQTSVKRLPTERRARS